MTEISSELFEKIRQQFDSAPYPSTPLEDSPKENISLLYIHNLVTPYYLRNQKVIDTKNKIILDAGCGTGYKSLVLAEANPGAKIVGIDISAESIKLAQQRLEYYGFDNAEFYVLPVQELNKLNYKFDYINCDEMLYLFPDLTVALRAMKEVLQPEGIIRSNLHSLYQRFNFFRAQKLFSIMGLLDGNPEDLEIDIVVETMEALRDNVNLKVVTWDSAKYKGERKKHAILMNHLFQGDKGYSITDMFDALRGSDLEFISMVDWREWNLLSLFKEPDNLPAFWGISLPETTVEQQLQLFELINPVHRLLDFWCGHPDQGKPFTPIAEWNDEEWQNAKVYLHSQLNIPKFEQYLTTSVTEGKIFTLDKKSPTARIPLELDSLMATSLVPLLEQPQPFISIVDRWLQVRPLDPVTLQPTDPQKAFDIIKKLFITLEGSGYIMLEQP
ncbi:MAG TPA: class I SAM-dependent methyltransferase [Nostocaceae cyanobacterium]|nr:class I SAM-dependent methyltransferase [Nostocaceae cyanobacterium]